jgi:hypothetical protein
MGPLKAFVRTKTAILLVVLVLETKTRYRGANRVQLQIE